MKHKKILFLLSSIVLIALLGYGIYQINKNDFLFDIYKGRGDKKAEFEKFSREAQVCLVYEGNVYYITKGKKVREFAPPCRMVGEMSTVDIPEGYQYKGLLKYEVINRANYKQFNNVSMAYREYDIDFGGKFHYCSGAKTLKLYYNAVTDSCFVTFAGSSQKEDGVAWFERDDDRFGMNLTK